jgi:hypothetical protein
MANPLTSANSFNLNDSPYSGTAYNATLTGASKTAQAQTSGPLSGGTGDTLVASSAASNSTLFGGSHNDSLVALGANVRLVQNSTGNDTLIGNASTTFQLGAASLLGNNSLKGAGTNGLLIASASTLNDSFGGMSGISTVSLTGASSISLGANADIEGITHIYAQSGNSLANTSFNQIAGDTLTTTLVGGSGSDLFKFTTKTSLWSLEGGGGIDTVYFAFPTTFNDFPTLNAQNPFYTNKDVEILELFGSSAATLGANASRAGYTTIIGGNGATTINGAADTNSLTINTSANSLGHDLITGTSKNDLVIVNGGAFSTETLNGGGGVNTLATTNNVTIYDSMFGGNIKNFQALQVGTNSSSGPGSSVTLGSGALATGITSVYGGAGNDSFTQLPVDTLAITFSGGAGNDTFSFSSLSTFLADSIAGGAGKDVLQFTSPQTLNDPFQRVSSVEVLSLNGSSQVTLAGNAVNAGIYSVVGGTGPSTINAWNDTLNLTLDLSATTLTSAPGDSLVGSFLGTNDFIIQGTLASSDIETIRGGIGNDTITVLGSTTLDDNFLNVRSVEVLSLDSLGGASQVTLGANASQAGIRTVIGGAGDDTLVQTSADTTRLTLLGGSGNDSISVFSQSELAGDSIGGGTGNNTLQIGSSAYLNDAFANVTGIQNLNLTSQSSVTLGANAQNTGITLVTGGQGSDTFTQTAADTLHTALFAGGDSALFKIANNTLLGNDTIVGGVRTDTLALTTASQTLSSFTNVFGIDVLSLAGGYNAATLTGSSFSTVIGGSGNDSFTEASLGQFAINGAGGINTIALTSHGYTYDSQFGGTSSVQVLKTASGSYNIVSLGSQAHQSGLSTIVSGAGSTNIILDTSAFGNRLAVDGSAAVDNVVFFDNVDQFGGSTLIGNTLTSSSYSNFADIAGGGNVGDRAFQNKTHLSELYIGGTASYKYGTGSSAPTGITLGSYAQDAGTTFVGTGSGKYDGPISINQLASDTLHLSLTGGDGNDSFTVANSSLLANDTINGGNGTDTLAISSTLGQTISAFSNVSNVDILSLTSGSDAVTLTGSTFSTVIGGGGNDSFTEASLGSYFINGGTGVDTVAVTAAVTSNDNFSSITNVEVLSLGAASQVTLGANAYAEGLQSIVAGAAGNTFTEATTTSFFINGNANSTLNLTQSGYISNFSSLSGIAQINLTSPTSITLTGAAAAGVQTVNGGVGNDTFTESSLNSYVINGGAGTDTVIFTSSLNAGSNSFGSLSNIEVLDLANANNVLDLTGTGSLGAAAAGIQSVLGGSGNDSFTEASLGSFFINGGTGTNTVTVTNSGSYITDKQFGSLANVQVLRTGSDSPAITLGSQAQAAGIQSIIGGTGSAYVTENSGFNNAIYDNQTASSQYTGIQFSNLHQFVDATLLGGSGGFGVNIDANVAISDNNFSNDRGVTKLFLNYPLASESTVTLGAHAQTAGITLVANNGNADSSIEATQLATDTLHIEYQLAESSYAHNSRVVLANSTLLANDTIVGSGNGDTLALATGSSLNSTSFAHVSNVSVLALTGSNNVTLNGTSFSTVIGGSGNDSFAVASTNSGSYSNFGHATIVGNGGTDTVSLSVTNNFSNTYSSSFIEDTAFGALKQIGVINVSDSATGAEGAYAATAVTLGAQALAAGVQSLSASASASSDGYAVITETAEFNRAVALTLGGANSNYLNLDNGVQFVGDTITAVANADNADVSIAQSTTLSDSAFLNKSGILFLDLNDHSAGSSSVELGTYASLAGVNVVYANGGELRATIDGSYGHASGNGAIVYGGNGNDFVQASSIDQINFYSGSNGTDTLAISSGSQTLSGFNNISSVEVLSLSGGDNVVDLTGVGSQFTTVIGGSGNDSFTVANLGAEIVGNGGNDTVAITNGGTLGDAQFGRLSNVEVLQVGSGFSEVELGVQAQIAGISTVVAGSNSGIYLSVDANYNRGLNFQGSASSSYEGVLFNSANLDFAPTLVGGSNPYNTINLEYGSTISDNLFSNVSGFPVVDLNSQTGASAITLAGAAQSAGILTVDGGQGSVNITQTADDTLATVLNGGNAGNNSFTVSTESFTSETLTGSALYSSIGRNSFSSYGGLNWGNAGVEVGAFRPGYSSLGTNFVGYNNPSMTLSGINGKIALQSAEITGVVTTDTLSISGYNSLGGLVWYSTLSGSAYNFSPIAGSNTPVDYVVETNSNFAPAYFTNVVVELPPTIYFHNDTINGNGGHNTLNVSNAATLADAAFTNVHNMTVLSLSGASDVTLGGIALGNNNLQSVFGGNGGDSFAIGNLGTIDIVGGTGIDTIGLTNSASAFISDSLFSKVASVEVLKTSASGSYTSISLGSAAQESGVSTIVATPSNDTVGTTYTGNVYVDVQTGFNRPLYFDGLNTAAPIGLRFATATQVDHATIYGGSSTLNELAVQSTATLNDSQFQNIHNIQELNLNEASVSGLSDVTLGANAFATGIASIYGGNGTIDVTQTTEDSSALYIVGGELGGNVYNIGDFSLLGGQSLPPPNNAIVPAIPNPFIAGDTIFGSGNDTLIVGGTSTIANQFVNIHGVEALSLTGSNSSVLIDNSAYATGIETVYGALNGSTIGQQVTDTKGSLESGVNIYGNDGNDLIALLGTDSLNHSAIALLNNDVIDGGRGVNTIALTSSSKYNEIGDQSFVNVENVQNLVLGYYGINPGLTAVINPAINVIGAFSVTLGSSAFHAGLQTVTAGVGDTVYAAWNETGRNLTLDASNNFINGQNTLGFNLLIGQQERGAVGLNDVLTNSLLGNESFFYDTLSAITQPYPYTNEFIVNNGAALSTSTVVGGLGFNDSLYINSPYSVGGSVQDSDFQNTNFINNLVLNGNSGATLGAEASAAFNTFGTGSSKYGSLSGVHTVWGGHDYDTATGNTLGDTIVQQTSWSSYHGLTVVGGHGNDSIVVDSYALLQNDSIYGGFSLQSGGVVTNHGMDTLAVEGGVTLNDSFGTGQVNEIEALQLSCNTGAEGDVGSAITLGANFASLGLGSIYGSDCNDTITILSTDTLATYVNGLAGNDSVIVDFGGAAGSLAAFNNDTLNGGGTGSGESNTLVVGVTATLNDSDFLNVSNFQALQLTGGEGSAVTLGSTAQSAGFVSVYGSTGSDTIVQLGSDKLVNYIQGNEGNDTISVANDTLMANDTIDGGTGSNTLNAASSASSYRRYSDLAFANKSNFDVLTTNLVGSGSGHYTGVTLGSNASLAGFSSVISGSASGNYITQETSNNKALYIDNRASSTYSGMYFYSDTLFASDTVVGASRNIADPYNNWTEVYNGPTLSDSAFQHKTSLSGFYVFGDSAVTLEGNAQTAGISGLYAEAGNDTLTVTTGDTLVSTIRGGAGNDLVTVPSLSQFGGLYGGLLNTGSGSYSASGTDTLSLTQTLTNNDSFGNVHDFQALQLTGAEGGAGNAVTFGGGAQKAGFQSLWSGNGNDTLTIISTDTLLSYVNAQDGNDYVSVPTLTQFSTLDGGAGIDTLSIDGGVTLNDGQYGGTTVVNFEALQVGCSNDAQSIGSAVTLGGNAASSSLGSLFGSDCNDTLTILSTDTLPTYLNAQQGNDLVTVDFGGAAGSLPAFNGSTLDGGGGTDALHVGVAATLHDNDFGNVHSFDALVLSGNNSSTNLVTLGGTAQTTGFSSVFAGTSAAANVNASAYTNNIYITGSGSSYGMTFAGGSGNDTLIGSYATPDSMVGNGGNNLFQFDNAANLGNSTITGAAGIDTLQLTKAGNINDAFAHDTLLNALVLAGGSNATLAANAQNAGLSSVYLHDSTGSGVYQQAGDTLQSYLSGSSGNDLFQFANDTLLGNDTVAGSGGTDTIAIMSAATLNDGPFLNVSGVEVLSLTGATTALFAPGGNAQSSGLSSIFGGSGGDSISANFTGANKIYIRGGSGADSISGGGGDDTLQGWTGTSTLNGSSDTMTGGSASDLFILGDATGNAYGQGGKSPIAFITDYNQKVDYLKLNGSAANYSTQTLAGAYNLQVTDTNTGGVVADLYVYNPDQPSFLTGGHVLYA